MRTHRRTLDRSTLMPRANILTGACMRAHTAACETRPSFVWPGRVHAARQWGAWFEIWSPSPSAPWCSSLHGAASPQPGQTVQEEGGKVEARIRMWEGGEGRRRGKEAGEGEGG